jgi:hypothetical protein
MSYKIKIEKTTVVTKMVRGAWGSVSDNSDVEYAYAPDREDEVETTKYIYEQIVDDLDVLGVIEAVNRKPEVS